MSEGQDPNRTMPPSGSPGPAPSRLRGFLRQGLEAPTGLPWRPMLGLPTWLAAAVSLGGTLLLTVWMYLDLQREAEVEFRYGCEQLELKLAERLEGHRQILQSVAGLYEASTGGVTRGEFRAFARRLMGDRRFQGIQGVGVSVPLLPGDLARHTEGVRREGFPDYAVRPAGDRERYSSILYLEPFRGRNLRAFGYDMYAEPVRRKAMEAARDLGSASLSGKVTLVQETDRDVQAGALMYVPIYRPGLPLETPEQRRNAFQAWAHSPFRMKDLVEGILGERPPGQPGAIRLKIFDCPHPDPHCLLFDSAGGAASGDVGHTLSRTLPLQDIALAGEPWTLRFSHLPVHPPLERVWASLAGGLCMSGFVTTLVALFLGTRASARTQRHREEMLRRTEGLSQIGSWEWEVATRRVTWSAELYRFMGRAPEAGVPSFETQLEPFLPEDRVQLRDATFALLKAGTPYELELRSRSGRILMAQGHVEAGTDGAPKRLYGFLQDITERRRAEEEHRTLQRQLQQAQKLDSLGSLAGGVAHDMNNILGAVLGLASAQLQASPDPATSRRIAERIVQACERGRRMVQGLLTFARQHPAEERELDLNALIREEVGLLEHTTLAKVRLVVELDPDLHTVRGDAGALAHALMNLCVNAVDAMQEQGTLTLRSRNRGPQEVEVEVEDTGCGMTREVLEKAFDPFFTTKPQGKGTGLGLSMVYSTVKAHHGRLELHSDPGKGTRVSLRFPASPRSEAVPLDPRPSARGTPDALRVLVVDDDELMQAALRTLLETLGHQVHVAGDGEAALEALQGGLDPEVVILDLNMPGLGGAETLPRLKALKPDLPVLLTTGRADQAALELVKRHSGVWLLPKPFTLEELGRLMARI